MLKTKKPIFILGLNEALCSSAALLKDGKIIAGASEERFTGIKNQWGFPKKAIKFCLNYAGITSKDLNLVVLSYLDPYTHFTFNRAKERQDLAPNFLLKLRDLAPKIEYNFPFLNPLTDSFRKLYYLIYQPINQNKQIHDIAYSLGINRDKIIRMDHHLAHAYTAYYSNPKRSDIDTLVLTSDGAGDQICSSVYVVKGNKFKLISKTPHSHSLGLFYASITHYLGLKPHEDEYKVMGLAPYAKKSAQINKIYSVFKKLIWVEGLKFNSSIPSRHFGFYLRDKLHFFRFDSIAAAAQQLTEDLLTEWIENAVKKIRIQNLAVGGGVFQNVKANQKILNLKKVKEIFFMPSPGDETNAIGAAYYGYQLKSKTFTSPLADLYLGPQYSEKEIKKALSKFPKLKAKKLKSISKVVAKLLVDGEIVARFSGRMEMGARALGNRSILADPRNLDAKEKINKMIKMRDFWMPFAPTILAENNIYLKNPKKVHSPFMMLAFDTTDEGKKTLAAAIHPADQTTRPQILKKEDNPKYYEIIEDFTRLTGVSALLNTSFNIHGQPIVCTPEDALKTLMSSGLKYLSLEDFLVSKNA